MRIFNKVLLLCRARECDQLGLSRGGFSSEVDELKLNDFQTDNVSK